MAEIESIVQPYGVLDDSGWKLVTFVCSHARIIKHEQLICQYPALVGATLMFELLCLLAAAHSRS